MTWASRRRLIITLIVLAFFGLLAFWHYYADIFRAPLCTDGVKNGDETGIDCGGSMCTTLCTFEVKEPTVLWSRAFPVTASVYNAAAYIENSNDAAVEQIPYEFRLYDDRGVLAARVDGIAEIPPKGNYAIVETGIAVGNSVIARTTFEFSKTPPKWERVPDDVKALKILTSDDHLDTSGAVTRLNATLSNPSPIATLQNTVVAAILYDANDNAVHVSRTILPTLGPEVKQPIFFTWPSKLTADVVRYDIIPIINVFDVIKP